MARKATSAKPARPSLQRNSVLDLARAAAHNVTRPAGPITTYLVGYAAGRQGANPEQVDRLAARAQALADALDRPADAKDPVDIDDEVPDDTGVDHTGEKFLDEGEEE